VRLVRLGRRAASERGLRTRDRLNLHCVWGGGGWLG
jgi:hypothetical protein